MYEQQQAALEAIVLKHAPTEGEHATAIPWLQCYKHTHPNKTTLVVYTPSVYFVVQGAKEVLLADEVYCYGAADYLIVTVDLPLTSQVIQATPTTPFLCLRVDIDAQTMRDVVAQHGNLDTGTTGVHRGLFVGTANARLTDAVVRLAALLDQPDDISFLASLVTKELYYHLLKSAYGAQIARVTVAGSPVHRIAHVIAFMKQHVHQPVHIDALAAMAHMSVSSFHHIFKDVTAMSPLQYHKRLRLLEGRRLMVNEDADATTAGLRVGYESPSQFSRDYRRLFGTPPRQDVVKLRARV